jgi:uncharacterized protein YpuA (DUF1002 family)
MDCSTEERAWNQEMIRFRTFVEDVSQAQLKFTRHFADRMNDPRNKPAVKVQELQQLFKRIARNKAKNIRQNPDSQAVIKDMQNDLNLPIVINYDKNKDEFEVINKTIMRKKDFGTSNKVFKI